MPGLVEIALVGLDEDMGQPVVDLFDRWGQGGAVVEHVIAGDPGVTIKTYLLDEDDAALCHIEIGLTLLGQVQDASSGRLPAPQIRYLSETDWAEAWKADYDVLRIGRRLVIKPTWRDFTPGPDDLVIQLDPGLAFGSGLHPTTRLCLEALEDYLGPTATVLDVGTGSGVLAVAAARLGASRVLALDVDSLAVRVARENVALNQVESVVCVEMGTVRISNIKYQIPNIRYPKGTPSQISLARRPGRANVKPPVSDLEPQAWDVVVANILAETIVELAPGLAASLSPKGTLIASGIIADRVESVVAGLRDSQLSVIERRDDGEWVALIARRAKS